MKTMKIKDLMMMMVAAVTLTFGVCACSSDDDDDTKPAAVAVADQVAGTYTGKQVLTVMGEPDEGTVTFVFTKSSDNAVDMTIPAYGEGMMTIPEMLVKGIALTKSESQIYTGSLASYAGVVKNNDGTEKAYTVSDVSVIFTDNDAVVAYSLQYGNMPFKFVGQFTGKKQN